MREPKFFKIINILLNMGKIAVIGESGFLGSKLLKIISETYTVVGTYQNK